MKTWLAALFSSDETIADSIIVFGFMALVVMSILTGVALVLAPMSFSPGAYAGGATALLGFVAGGKTVRDRWAPTPGPQQ